MTTDDLTAPGATAHGLTRRRLFHGAGAAALVGGASLAAPAAVARTSGGGGGWSLLDARLSGELVRPGDPRYDTAKQLHIAEYDAVRPSGIAFCETPDDVSACVDFARRERVPLRIRSGGHNYAGWSTSPGLVVDLSAFDRDFETGTTVRVGPGSKAIDALTGLDAAGLQIVEGTCPTVCAGGFVSGGGVGYQTPKYGLGADRVVSALVVLADGSRRRVGPHRAPELFWALRGGGGNTFGVVLEWEVEPIPQPTATQFTAVYPTSAAVRVFDAWQRHYASGARELGSSFVLVLPDAAPDQEPLCLITGVHHAGEAALDVDLAAISAAARTEPLSVSKRSGTFLEAMKAAWGCDALTPDQCHTIGQTPTAQLPRTGWQRESYRFFNRPVDTGTVRAWVDGLGRDRAAGTYRVLHTIGLGGALADRRPGDTAFVHRDAIFVGGFVTQLASPTPASAAAAESWLSSVTTVLDPPSSGAYVNFVSSRLDGWRRRYWGDNYPRLLAAKRRYDPSNLFTTPRAVGA